LDLPSHAKSEKMPELSMDLYVDVVKTLILSLNLKDIILCGHSLGGAIAQSYFFKYPENLQALVLVSTGARLRVSSLIFEALKKNLNEYIDSIPVGAFYRKTNRNIIEKLIQEVKKTDSTVIYDDFRICDTFDTLERTNSIKVPVLILVGKQDKLTPVKYSQFFHEQIVHSQLRIIEKAGHQVMIERPGEFNEALEKFLNQL